MTLVDRLTTGDSTVTVVGGRYALGEVAGHGGMSTVYRARDLKTSTTVAVKLFHPGIELSDSATRRRREVQVASALHHPDIIKVLDADVEAASGGRAYIVTEFVDGPTLGQRLRRQPLTEPQAMAMGETLCDVLDYMHQRDIVHRDVKPANILLAREADDDSLHPKLTDFGLAFAVDSTRMTGVGLTAGTPNYLSPEQVRGQPIAPASDIYSLGLVLIEVLTGAPVFAGHGIEAALARLTSDPTPPPNLNPRFAELLEAMTASDPDDRPTAAQARTRLFAIEHGGSLASELIAIALDPRLTPTQIRTGRWRPFGVAAATGVLLCTAALAAVAIALAGLLGGSSPSPAQPVDVAATTPSAASSTAGSAQPSSPRTDSGIGISSRAPETAPTLAPSASMPSTQIAIAPVTAASTVQPAGKSHGKNNGNRKGN